MINKRDSAINIAGLSFLLADPNPHSLAIIHGILRGFGANRVIEVRNRRDAIQVLMDQKIDMMLLEPRLPPGSGLAFVKGIRGDLNNPCRTLPILVVTGDTRTSTVKAARDSGANMVIAKPVSPTTLYDRLAWVAFHPLLLPKRTTILARIAASRSRAFPTAAASERATVMQRWLRTKDQHCRKTRSITFSGQRGPAVKSSSPRAARTVLITL